MKPMLGRMIWGAHEYHLQYDFQIVLTVLIYVLPILVTQTSLYLYNFIIFPENALLRWRKIDLQLEDILDSSSY